MILLSLHNLPLTLFGVASHLLSRLITSHMAILGLRAALLKLNPKLYTKGYLLTENF